MKYLRDVIARKRPRPASAEQRDTEDSDQVPDFFDLDAVRARVAGIDARLRVFAMGHLGDGNLHLTISSGEAAARHYEAVSEAVYADLARAGGSFSAEHGIGLEKRAALVRHAAAGKQALMHAIKTAFDPNGIMNPGKVLQPLRDAGAGSG